MPIFAAMKKKKLKKSFQKARYIVYKETRHNPRDNAWSFFGGFLGLSTIGILQGLFHTDDNSDILFLIGAFGATSVILFGNPHGPFAQPRNLFLGSLISAVIGVTVYKFFYIESMIWFSPALSVSLAILAMQYTKTLHPPGGAIALIANIGSDEIKSMGYFYVINPILTGIIILFVMAILFNNLSKNRVYPYRDEEIRPLKYGEKVYFWKKETKQTEF
ncbi:CBS-domain-containing membrane protein [Belliella baltica DSM 15883]|uniref:CBS-domain-containing membrane protein n=3 Tax=Cytophagales TaxID=768507 RepID=I3Z5R0_BELBD|nr:CBS-domain-containing membrane protein [Belliella baltica DSM 15883]MBW3469796.1 HPP family protein [Arthrospiribacter ruber]